MILKMKSAVHHAVPVSLIITVALAIFHWNNTLQFASVSHTLWCGKGIMADYYRYSGGYLQL